MQFYIAHSEEFGDELDLLPFHGLMSHNELEIKQKYATNVNAARKCVLLSTNISESSITLGNLVLVIDFGLCKIPDYHDATGCEMLKLTWADRSMLNQRKGRVGRVCHGGIVHMMSRKQYNSQQSIEPEIQRSKLENLVLSLSNFRAKKWFNVRLIN
jgi:HrpA-like RNA helicase